AIGPLDASLVDLADGSPGDAPSQRPFPDLPGQAFPGSRRQPLAVVQSHDGSLRVQQDRGGENRPGEASPPRFIHPDGPPARSVPVHGSPCVTPPRDRPVPSGRASPGENPREETRRLAADRAIRRSPNGPAAARCAPARPGDPRACRAPAGSAGPSPPDPGPQTTG